MDRNTIKESIKKTIDEIFVKIDEFEAKSESVKESTKDVYNTKIAELKLKKIELQDTYNDLMDASEEKWEEVKESLSVSTEYFKKGFAELGAMFK